MYHHQILTVRDSTEQWHESVCSTVMAQGWDRNFGPARTLRTLLYKPFLPVARTMKRFEDLCYNHYMFNGMHENGKQFYENHYDEVRKALQQERLLVFNVKEGWGPLCAFLGKPVPDWDFPRKNERKAFIATIGGYNDWLEEVARKRMLYVGALSVITLAAVWAMSVKA